MTYLFDRGIARIPYLYDRITTENFGSGIFMKNTTRLEPGVPLEAAHGKRFCSVNNFYNTETAETVEACMQQTDCSKIGSNIDAVW